MRVMFFYNVGEDVGSAQTIRNYCRVGREMGHEVAVYGKPRPNSTLSRSNNRPAWPALSSRR